MITDNKRVRFCENNFIDSSIVMDFSSELAEFPFSNSYLSERTKLWKPSGYFKIENSNSFIHINDGSNKNVQITVGEYQSPTLLASEIQTKLNSISSGFTVEFTTSFKFKISRTSSFTFRVDNVLNSIAQTIGFVSLVDYVGSSLTAERISNHTSEWATFDFGYAASVDFVAIIGPVDEIFTISPTAEVKIYANNINDFTSPAFTKTLTRYDAGIINFIDDYDSSFRYWKIEIKDANNINGPQCFSIGNIYIGDYQTLESRNLENGFTQTFGDKSEKYEAESGALFFDKRQKIKSFEGISLGYLNKTDKKMFDSMFQKLGLSESFYVSLDPTGCFTDDLDELTRFVRFNSEPQYRHIVRDIFSISTSFSECV